MIAGPCSSGQFFMLFPLPSLRQLKLKCGPQFEAQWTCLQYKNQSYDKCRKTQSALDECVFQTMVRGCGGVALARVFFPPHSCRSPHSPPQGLEGAFKTYDTSRSHSSYNKK